MTAAVGEKLLNLIDFEGEVRCEAQWNDSPECGKPARWTVMGHSSSHHTFEPCPICNDCLIKLRLFGFFSPATACIGCRAEGPLARDLRPI